MTREEAKEILTHNWTRVDNPNYSESELDEAFFMAITALQQTAWIPAEDEPPKQKKTYWICTDSGYQCECRWTNVNPFWTDLTTDWHWCIGDVPQYSKVVAWKPLPEPYKGGDEE